MQIQEKEELSSQEKVRTFYGDKQSIAMLEKIPLKFRSSVIRTLLYNWPDYIEDNFKGKLHKVEIGVGDNYLSFFNSIEPFSITFSDIVDNIKNHSFSLALNEILEKLDKMKVYVNKVELTDVLIQVYSNYLQEKVK